jgi:predicted transposase YdaD
MRGRGGDEGEEKEKRKGIKEGPTGNRVPILTNNELHPKQNEKANCVDTNFLKDFLIFVNEKIFLV